MGFAAAIWLSGGAATAQDEPEGGDVPPDRGDVSVPKGEGGAILKPPVPQPAPQNQARPPRVVTYVPPDYPPAAKEQGLEGTVILQLDIDQNGDVTNAVVVNPAGNGFDEAAIAASKKLKFDPARRANGNPAPARIEYRYSFTLADQPAGPTDPSAPPEPQGPVMNFGGKVLSSGGDAALAGASVIAVSPDGTRYEATTGANGSFELPDMPAGNYAVTISASGFENLTVTEEISTTERTEVKYRLVLEGSGLEVTVRGERPPREVVKRTLERREIARIPGTNGDALRSIQNLPGVARPPGIAGVLLVRGSGPADTQTFIDGTPVPLIYHFGGLSSVVPTEILDRIDFYPGNFSAQYGRVQGGIVDVAIRSPASDGYHGLVQTDLIDSRALFEGPVPYLEGWTFIAAARRSFIDAWLGPVLDAAGAGVTQAPVYFDYQFVLEHDDPEDGKFRVSYFGSDDQLALLLDEPSPNEPALSGNVGLATAFQRIQVQYENDFTPQDRVKTVLALGQDDLRFGLGPLFFNLNVKTLTGRFEYGHQFSREVSLNMGLDVFSGTSEVSLRLPAAQRPGQPPNTPFSTRTVQNLTAEEDFFFPATYAELELVPDKRVRLVPGIRFDFQSFNDEFTASPRVNGRYNIVHDFPRSTVKAGVGMFHQPPQFQQVVEPLGNPNLASNRAIHYALGYEQELTRHLEASVEGFYKQIDSRVTATADESGSGNNYDNQGRAYAVGAEVLLKYKPDDRFFGWVAYTLSRSIRRDRPDEPEVPVTWDQPHILTILGSYRLGHGWEFGARFRLVSGNLFTPNVCNPELAECDPNRSNALYFAPSGSYVAIPFSEQASERLPLFHQLDIRLDRRWEFDTWQLSAYLDIQNVYNNQNSEAVQYNFNFTARDFVSGLPILPSIGVRADF